jgi:plastocyanin
MRQTSESRPRRRKQAAVTAAVACIIAILAISVFAGACGGTATTTTTAASPGTTTAGATSAAQIVMKGFAFVPADVTIKAGESVTWTNEDSVTHDVTADDGGFQSGNMENGATFTFTFDKAGSYPYYCALHPTMTGTITVQ